MSTEKKADFSDVSATVTSTEQRVEKADFSDVTATVTSTEEIVGEQTYTIAKGDTLSKIAKTVYGDMMKYPIIFEANKPMLTDPDKIYPGQVLRIPAL